MRRNLTALVLNLIAGLVIFSYMPHLSGFIFHVLAGFCFGTAVACFFDLYRAWPTCDCRLIDHRCTRMKWHLGSHHCGGKLCGYKWPRWLHEIKEIQKPKAPSKTGLWP